MKSLSAGKVKPAGEGEFIPFNVMTMRVAPEDVAEAVAFLASERASKSTGNMLVVDAGVREAFPR